ncbi:MAG: TrbG/VirB9 family P-type conjugative transfer protein [Fusobacterium sp.]|uniref:TrbG/VirB9 family P-type conjugative transfer protein n=1 Tax=Fusobacterium sp. TaxID=68766 RepID=UPI0026DA7B20|nr:TrbG/VirB9 family P-type conjugative transfer protein [Fusobacterium sp.]MDO4689828.1 TrbG/VirB9 family P-type conjugative transfer protein [Fusobacterium sp.]
MKKYIFCLCLLLSSISFSAVDRASEFDEYSTRQPQIEKGYKKSKTDVVSTYFYNEKDSYRIITRAGYISTVILNKDEDIIHAEIGDATRWSIQTYYTGSEKGMSPAISIKPFIPELRTNLIISTTKRIYNLVLEASLNSYAPITTFEYPKEIELLNIQKREREKDEIKIDLSNMNFNYEWKKNKYSWSPVAVYDDGKKTVITMPENIDTQQLPALFIKDEQTGDDAIVRNRYNPRLNAYVIDRLIEQAVLKIGDREIIIKRKGSFIKKKENFSVSL